ncbi:uncharacterized protein LOC108156826 [Drosophila miranda]|uniref:uncharacterized protein LOC108156826 n=1 Tax=Drosophila miranda TaxID=7229 RepID=UPI0007E5CFE5|nr:uncharacterized protein LOC108156826 [Drosophila miranda]
MATPRADNLWGKSKTRVFKEPSNIVSKMSSSVAARSLASRCNSNIKPECASEALVLLETLLIGRNTKNLVVKIVSENIFLEGINDGGGRQTHPLMQEYQLTITLIEFFSKPGPRRDAIFHALFGSQLSPQRSSQLVKLVSIAVSISVVPVLTAAGTWLQQVGYKSTLSQEVTKQIVDDFAFYSLPAREQLKQLSMIAPHFAASFMVAVADIYLNERRSTGLTPPPEHLLDVFSDWITKNLTVCKAPPPVLGLPAGATAGPFVNPLASLMRWTILAPLVSQTAAYSKLHLSVLTTLQQLAAIDKSTAVANRELLQTAKSLQSYCARLRRRKLKPEDDAAYQRSMARFAQAVQIALCSKCLTNRYPLITALKALPPFKLMSIVISSSKRR